MMPGSVTAIPGPYRTRITPYAKAIMESFEDPAVQTTVLALASRLCKTETLLNVIGQAIDEDPSNILVLYPTLDAAKNFFAESVDPMLSASRCFRGKISSARKRDGQNTSLKKRFPGGVLRGIGANVPSAFRGVQARRVIADEIDAMQDGKEGDPIQLLLKRAENYPNAVQILSSTPTNVGTSRIWKWLELSDFQKYYVPSPKTGNWHVLDWANVIWEEGKPETAQYIDPDTQEPWTEDERLNAIHQGEWRATQPFTGIRGFWADGLISTFPPKKGYRTKLHQFASEFLDATKGGNETMRVWHNTFRALPWEEEHESIEWEIISQRTEAYAIDPIPDRCRMITVAGDVQDNRIELEWVGWGDDFESWGLGYIRLMGDTKQKEVWDKLGIELRRKWQHPCGMTMKLARGMIDEGYRPEMTRVFCLQMMRSGYEVYPCKGIGRTGILEPELVQFNPNKKQKGIKAPTFNIGSSRGKRTIYNHLLAQPPGPNTMHWPQGFGYDDNYFQMLTVERVATRYSYGKPYKEFVCPNGARNESLDIRVYNYAAAVSLNPSWQGLLDRIEDFKAIKSKADEESKKEPKIDVSKNLIQNGLTSEETEPKEPMVTRRNGPSRGGGFVNSY